MPRHLPPLLLFELRTVLDTVAETTTDGTCLERTPRGCTRVVNLRQERRDALFGLDEEVLEIEERLVGVVGVDKRRCDSRLA